MLRLLVDNDAFAAWNAHAALAGSQHQDNSHNVTLYFNNASGQFEFFPEDVYLFPAKENPSDTRNDLADFLLSDQQIVNRRNDVLRTYLEDEREQKDDLRFLDSLYKQIRYDVYADRLKRYGNVIFDFEYHKFRRMIESNNTLILDALNNSSSLIHIPNNPDTLAATQVPTEDDTKDRSTIFSRLREASDIDLFASAHPAFRVDHERDEITIGPGSYTIRSTVIVPKGYVLNILPGTQLLFGPRASLVSYSNIVASGTENQPIRFLREKLSTPWGVVAVVNADHSIFRHCEMSGGSDDRVNGILFTGMLASHYTDAFIEDCVFRSASGDDAVNVKGGIAEITRSVFDRNAFDAIDLDWASHSQVTENVFINNGNDAIDIGGGTGQIVRRNVVSGSGDKCVSIGEGSKLVTIFDNLFTGCVSGIAVKDASFAQVLNTTIANCQTGVAAYEKKPVFGGASVHISNSIIWDYSSTSVTHDAWSTVEVQFSNVQGGYVGTGNVDVPPVWDKEYRLTDGAGALLEGGDATLLESFGIHDMSSIRMGVLDYLSSEK